MSSEVDPDKFWSDKARSVRTATKVTEAITEELAKCAEELGAADPPPGLDEAIDRDIAAQAAARFAKLAAAVESPAGILDRLRTRTHDREDLDILVRVYPGLAIEVFSSTGDAFLELLKPYPELDRDFRALLAESAPKSGDGE